MTPVLLTLALGACLIAFATLGPRLLRQAAPVLVRMPRLAIGVIGGGGTGAAAWAAATLLGVRNGIYGMQLKALLRPPRRLFPVMAQFAIDESTATATAQDDHDERVRSYELLAGCGVMAAAA